MHLKTFPWLDDQRRSRSPDHAIHLLMRDDVCAAATAPQSFYSTLLIRSTGGLESCEIGLPVLAHSIPRGISEDPPELPGKASEIYRESGATRLHEYAGYLSSRV